MPMTTENNTDPQPVSLRELVRRADDYLAGDGEGDAAEGLTDADALVLHCLIMGQTPDEVADYGRRMVAFVGRLQLRHVEGREPAQTAADPFCPACLSSLRPGVPCELCALEAHLRATGFE